MELKQLFNTYNRYVDFLEQHLSKMYAVPEITLVKYDDNDVYSRWFGLVKGESNG